MVTDTTTTTGDATRVREGVDRATQTAHDTIDRMAAKAAPAIEQLQSAASGAAQALRDKAAALGEMEEAWVESARSCVRQHPLASVLVAVAVGVLISRMGSDRA
ncbi:hypothetical protein DEH84_03680 [Aquabacterium olei]|jgi:ElaB/YqjD/DUF883 family membrane-anchored ribosome-binding protein|uniref:DUF883 domain-containing protein n=1 Tax=Aquabacterium olei TaxID=1296669 RepID=A0A2U8FNL2_9BURK|nr:hypothetical protein [Aquabacterium olei]AWI52615.1 hypothetical protein DEH84_03680 [Aquabacterium olei]